MFAYADKECPRITAIYNCPYGVRSPQHFIADTFYRHSSSFYNIWIVANYSKTLWKPLVRKHIYLCLLSNQLHSRHALVMCEICLAPYKKQVEEWNAKSLSFTQAEVNSFQKCPALNGLRHQTWAGAGGSSLKWVREQRTPLNGKTC